MIVYPVLS